LLKIKIDMEDIISKLESHCNLTYKKLLLINKEDFRLKPDINRWSKKEILGHLIDSATNNHHRFIRAQYQDTPHIVYNQNQWVALSNYQDYSLSQLLDLWRVYNLHIVHILRHMPTSSLERKCETSSIYTLEYIAVDYLRHLEHHLGQIFSA
jgi:hypothetical protein